MHNSSEMKHFASKLVLYMSPFILLFVVFACTYYMYYKNEISPTDLTKLGMRIDDKSYYYSFDTLANNYLYAKYEYGEELKEKDSSTIWVFGDSFTQKGGNRVYANYLAHNLPDKKICLIEFSPGAPYNPVEQFVQIAHKEKLPPYVIVSLVERSLVDRLLKLDLTINDSLYTFMTDYRRPPYKKKKITEMAVEYYKKQLGIDNPVLTTKLKINAFSYTGSESELLFLDEDITIRFSEEEMGKAIDNIDMLFKFASAHNTNLIFLVCPDKFDMYQGYLSEESKYNANKNNTLDYVSKRVSQQGYVDAKMILQSYLKKGVKDIYFYNDTHWSPIASEIVAGHLCKYIK